MQPAKNGLEVVSMTPAPYQVWQGDKWRCGECGIEVVLGFGTKPISELFSDDFQRYLDAKPLEVVDE